MVKVITYGSYDMLHYGHIKLLERAKALGDYLIVGVTSDDYDKTRGKINLQQSLMERIEAVKETGIPDEVIVEEFEGQKIDDIKKYDIDIFTVGSDWTGQFDYLNEYCRVIYLPRTNGISSTEIRDKERSIRFGLVGDSLFLNKVWKESKYVNGIHIQALYTNNPDAMLGNARNEICTITNDYGAFLKEVDAVYIRSLPEKHYKHIKLALESGKHVLCESPITLSPIQYDELMSLALSKHVVLMEAIKTAYATAYTRLLLLLKAGKIGDIVSVDSVCTSIRENKNMNEWDSMYEWGPTALLPVLQILGVEYKNCTIISRQREDGNSVFAKIDLVYKDSVGSIKVGDGVKSEGELIVSGTKGYIYVPAPWWKTDYFEVRFENPENNQRYFYQLDGEGIRYELVAFIKAITKGYNTAFISNKVSREITTIMCKYHKGEIVEMKHSTVY